MLRHRKLAHRKPGHRKPDHRKLGQRNPGQLPGRRVLGRLALLTAVGLVSLAALPAAPALGAAAAPADAIRTNQQWVLDMLDAEAAWSVTRGAGVTVAVIDSGVNPYVSDLAGSVITGPDYTGVSTRPSSPEWGVHGTWMASLIAGHGHDGGYSGVIGMAPAARILSIRVIPDRGDPHYGTYEHERETAIQQSLADGIKYAVTHGAKVVSMSIGYSAPSGTVRAELQDAYDHGVVVIASAGNSGGPDSTRGAGAPESFPANYPGVISVGAVNSSAEVASFSSDNLSVQVAAPGVSVPAEGRDGQYWSVSGTSPACALVAGVAALIKSRYPDLPPDLVASAMTSTATHRPATGYDSQVGFGIVDAAAALTMAGQLARDRPAASSVRAAATYHGTLPPEPVGPRGPGQLILFILLALVSLALIALAATWLAVLRRSPGRSLGRANR
jgi:type VII secretion-associated serine protease mycosin